MDGTRIAELYDNFCIDLDGVLWNHGEFIEGSAESLKYLVDIGKKVFLVTNNTNVQSGQFKSRLESVGLGELLPYLYTTAHALVIYLENYYGKNCKLAIVGSDSLRKFVKEAGFQVIYPPDVKTQEISFDSILNFDVDKDIEVVVVAYDENFDYHSGLYLSACVQNGASLIGLQLDKFFLVGNLKYPSSGCWVRYIETATGKQALILGKPMKLMFEMIKNKNNLDTKKTIMIGDSMDSDIMFGKNSGMDTALVLSGVTRLDQLDNYSFKPDYIINCLGDLVKRN